MKKNIPVLLFGLLLAACNRQEVCRQDEQSIEAKILRISGPDTLELGKTIPLLIEVATDERLCITRVDGEVQLVNGSYVQLSAKLIYTGEQKDKGCNCNDDKTLHTLIYFTPNVAGRYLFTKEIWDTNAGTSWQGDSTGYYPFVR